MATQPSFKEGITKSKTSFYADKNVSLFGIKTLLMILSRYKLSLDFFSLLMWSLHNSNKFFSDWKVIHLQLIIIEMDRQDREECKNTASCLKPAPKTPQNGLLSKMKGIVIVYCMFRLPKFHSKFFQVKRRKHRVLLYT